MSNVFVSPLNNVSLNSFKPPEEQRKRELALALIKATKKGKYGELIMEKTRLNIAIDRVQNQIEQLKRNIPNSTEAFHLVQFYYHSYQEILAVLPAGYMPKNDLPLESEITLPKWEDIDSTVDENSSVELERRIGMLSTVQIEEIEEELVNETEITILTDYNTEEQLNAMLTKSCQENQEFEEGAIRPLKIELVKCKSVINALSLRDQFLQKETERLVNIGRSYKKAIDAPLSVNHTLPTPQTQSFASKIMDRIMSFRPFSCLFLVITNAIWPLSGSPPQTFYTTSNVNIEHNPQIAVNDKGFIVLLWTEDRCNKVLKFALKNPEGMWSSSKPIKEWEREDWEWIDEIDTLRCAIDPMGNPIFSWENDDGDWRFIESKLDGSYVAHTSIKANVDEFDSDFTPIVASNRNNKQFLLWGKGEECEMPAIIKAEQEKETSQCNALTQQNGVVEDEYEVVYYFFLAQQNPDGSWTNPEKIRVPVPYWRYSASKIHMNIDSNENIYVNIEAENDNGFFSLCRTNGQWSEFEFINKNEDLVQEVYPIPYQKYFDSVLDAQGNLMVIWEIEQISGSGIYVAYKPFDKPWLQPIALTSPYERNYRPLLKADKNSHFVLIWTKNSNWSDYSVYGMIFSSATLEWSDPKRLSPKDTRYSATCFDLSSNGYGAIAAISYENPFDVSIKSILISID